MTAGSVATNALRLAVALFGALAGLRFGAALGGGAGDGLDRLAATLLDLTQMDSLARTLFGWAWPTETAFGEAWHRLGWSFFGPLATATLANSTREAESRPGHERVAYRGGAWVAIVLVFGLLWTLLVPIWPVVVVSWLRMDAYRRPGFLGPRDVVALQVELRRLILIEAFAILTGAAAALGGL